MVEGNNIFSKILYGLVFTVLLPALLYFWSIELSGMFTLPIIESNLTGIVLALIGIVLIVVGCYLLYKYGDGLPMNAFPPKQFVSQNIYRYLSHPIYVGFVFFCFGFSILYKSTVGLWFISPIVLLGCITLVIGYEREDLKKRFKNNFVQPLLKIPEASTDPVDFWNRVSVYLFVFIPWLILYQAFVLAGPTADSFDLYFSFERSLGVVEWTEIFYLFTYIFVLSIPFICKTKIQLRSFTIVGLLANSFMILFFFVLPIIAEPREFFVSSVWGELLMFERSVDSINAAFPSYHVLWAFVASFYYSKVLPKLILLWYLIATLIAISCITTGMHSIADVVAGFLFAICLVNYEFLWKKLLQKVENFSNSWQEWRFGKVRLINHGIYAGIGAFLGLVIVSILVKEVNATVLLIYTASALLGGAMWAQLVEGSDKLLRPFGYYGSIIGGVLGIGIAALVTKIDFWLLMGAFAVASPFIQAVGRLRCLIQGCCHGRKTESENAGIRCFHPKSRVNKIANLRGELILPTPLYSITGNLVIGLVLARLWFLSLPASSIVGLYLILAGLARFMEEAYRGEPQTKVFAKLPLYQWMAVLSLLCGIICTMFDSIATPAQITFNINTFLVAFVSGVAATTAMGVDFPDSNKRFSRLTQ